MSQRQKESRFIKSLILCDDSSQCHLLQEKITKAEKDEKCMRGAVWLVLIMGMLSVSGLGYSAVFVPEIARFSSHISTRIFCVLTLTSIICLAVFVVVWWGYRSTTNRVYEECRRFVHGLMESKLKGVPPPPHVETTPNGKGAPLYQFKAPESQDEAELLQKAS